MTVTSVSKTEEKLSRTPSAIFVITQDDIRNSGATNIPDLLRIVPGVYVAQINANTWAITIRGFDARYANDVLILVDGRTMNAPTFGGVYWDVLDFPLEDIERIEVIRGPTGIVWGSNTDNGVINIITKSADKTQGGMVSAGGGNVYQGFATLQYGGAEGQSTNYRVFTKYFNQNDLPAVTGAPNSDNWQILRGGFRADSALSKKDSLAVEGDWYAGPENDTQRSLSSITAHAPQFFDNRVNLSGGFLQATWARDFSPQSGLSLIASYDHYDRPDILDERRSTLSVDFQHRFAWGQRQKVVWGLNYRYSNSSTTPNLFIRFETAALATTLYGAFVQDEIAVISNRLYLTLGAKLEHDYYNGFAIMPTARLTWNMSQRQMAWAAVSHAVRNPAENDAALRLNFGGFTPPNGTPILFVKLGNSDIENEKVIGYEAGYRASLSDRLSLDFSAFYNDYTQQETSEPIVPFLESTPAPPHLVEGTEYANLMYGETQGFELSGDWKVSRRWSIKPGYALSLIHMRLRPGSGDTSSVAGVEGSTPQNSATIRSHFALSSRLGWDTSAYFTGRLTDPAVPSYVRLDTGLSWQCLERFGISVFGQNLLASTHLEFVDPVQSTTSSLMKRGGYAKATWTF